MDVRFRAISEQIGDGDFELYHALRGRLGHKPEAWLSAFWRIRDGILLSNSIDDFLDRHEADDLMRISGKSAIAKTITEAEKTSLLMPKRRNDGFDILSIKETWVLKLIRMLGSGISSDKIFDNVSFISFNYDRCLEHFLWQAVRDLYAIPTHKLANVMGSLKVFHPYGSIGQLPIAGVSEGIPFGDTEQNYFDLSKNIFTYTEQIRDKKDIAEMHHFLTEAEQLVFLGFGFHVQNMQLLDVPGKMGGKQVYATLHKMSRPNGLVVRDRIGELFQGNTRPAVVQHSFHLADLTASGLIDEFRLVLTA